MFYDGVPFRASGSYETSNSFLTIGCSGTDYSNYYTGDIADVRVYNGALTEQQLKQMYKYGQQFYN